MQNGQRLRDECHWRRSPEGDGQKGTGKEEKVNEWFFSRRRSPFLLIILPLAVCSRPLVTGPNPKLIDHLNPGEVCIFY